MQAQRAISLALHSYGKKILHDGIDEDAWKVYNVDKELRQASAIITQVIKQDDQTK